MNDAVDRRPLVLRAADGAPLRSDAYVPAGAGPHPVVVMAHGFKGFKDWGAMPAIGAWFAAQGMLALAFNFSRNGVGEALSAFVEPDDFASNTLTREVDELEAVIDACRAGIAGLPVDPARLVLLGHSRGGGEAIVAAHERPAVRAVASWGGVASFDRWTDRQKRRWREKGALELLNARTGTMMRMASTFLDDLEAHAARLDIARCAATLACPLLLVHGAQDLTVLVAEAERLHACADPARSRLVIVPHTGHTFGAEHPFRGMTPALEEALRATDDFFREALAA